jgi:hypothetical protein
MLELYEVSKKTANYAYSVNGITYLLAPNTSATAPVATVISSLGATREEQTSASATPREPISAITTLMEPAKMPNADALRTLSLYIHYERKQRLG